MEDQEEEERVYEMEYEFPERPDHMKEKEEDIEIDQPLGDVYDVYGMASSVHSRMTSMTRDYTLAKYNSGIINEKFPKFIREQRKVVRILQSFMVVPKMVLAKRFNKDYAEYAHKLMLKSFSDIQKLLLGEIDEMVIISRAGKGEVIKAMLMHGKTKEEQQEYEQTVDSDTVLGRLKERSK